MKSITVSSKTIRKWLYSRNGMKFFHFFSSKCFKAKFKMPKCISTRNFFEFENTFYLQAPSNSKNLFGLDWGYEKAERPFIGK